MKKKMDFETKAKLIYSVELFVFSLVFLTIAILKFFNVIQYNSTRSTIFNWITLFGGSWLIADLIWALVDKKRQKRIALIDKIIHVPAGLYLVSFDLYCLISQTKEANVFQYGVAAVLTYLGLCYMFEAFYHFKYPVPGLIDSIEKAEQAEMEMQKEQENSSIEESEENNHE